jgi:hypothetical protein
MENSGDEQNDKQAQNHHCESRTLGLLRADLFTHSANADDSKRYEYNAREYQQRYVEGPLAAAVPENRQGWLRYVR